jgi:hypothetical protein
MRLVETILTVSVTNMFHYAFVLPQVFTNLFFNKQPEALIIQNLFCHKTLHVSGNFFVHHQDFSTVHTTLLRFMYVFYNRFQAESGWNCSSVLTLLGSGHQKPSRNLPVPNVL